MSLNVRGLIFIIIIIVILKQSLSSPTPKSVFKTCYDNNSLCFETDLSINLDPSNFAQGLEKLCPPGKTLPQIFGEVEQKALKDYLATLPRDVKYHAPIGLQIKYLQWSEVIKSKADDLSNENYLIMKLNKNNSLTLEADDEDNKLSFGCVTKAPCSCQTSGTKDSLCLNLDTCCLQININNNNSSNNNKLNYYDSLNYCKLRNNASLLTYEILSNNQKILSRLLSANVQELWAGETRVSLTWLNEVPAIYTHWHPGFPKDNAVFAYLKYDDKDGGWRTFQDGDLSGDVDDDDDDKYIAVCVGDENPNGMERPALKVIPDFTTTSNNSDIFPSHSMELLKIGLGLGLGLCLLMVLVLVAVVVVCLCYRKKQRRSGLQDETGKTPSVGTVSTSATSTGSRRAGSDLAGNGYNNYVSRNNFSHSNNEARIIPVGNYGPGYLGGSLAVPSNNRTYENIGSYEIPNGDPIVEHIYKAIRNPSVGYQRQLPQLPPERPTTLPLAPQQQYLQMRRNSYLDVIA